MAGRRGVCAELRPARVDTSCWAWKLAQTAQAIVWRPGCQRLLVIKFEVLSGRLVEKAQRLCHMMSVSQATFIYFCPKRVCQRAQSWGRGGPLRPNTGEAAGSPSRTAVKTILQQVQSDYQHLQSNNSLWLYPTEKTGPISLFRLFKRHQQERIIIKIHHFIIRQIPIVLSASGRYN